jgi:predicted phosphodiesterase
MAIAPSSLSISRPVRARLAPPRRDGAAPATDAKQTAAKPDLRFFFFADTHMGITLTDKFIKAANAEKPDLLVDGGDIVEDGTEAEFDKAWADRAKFQPELKVVTGNHDVLRRGPFSKDPPVLPDFQSFDRKGVHFILINDENARIGEKLFAQLEADLEANKGKTTIIAMHVPPVLTEYHGYVKLQKLLPFKAASPSLRDKAEIARFKALMKKYQVAAVLAGHTHAGSETTIDGTKYVIPGAVGGKTPGPGIQHEYLDIAVYGKDVQIQRIPLDKPPSNVVSHAIWTGNYIAGKNAYNHSVMGWDHFVPTTSAETRVGLRSTTHDGKESTAVTLTGEIETSQHPEAKGAFFAEGTAGIGTKEATIDLAAGYKRRVYGTFSKNAYVSIAPVVNAGVIGNDLTAGIGARAAVGAEVKNWTFQLSHEQATNRKATMFSVGFRF